MNDEYLPDWQREINDCERCGGARWLSVGKHDDPLSKPGGLVPCERCNADGKRELFDSTKERA